MPACPWAKKELDLAYHDLEWGVPVRDDPKLFEMLILEGAQAGLSWSTILAKRENYRQALDGFDAERIARYTPARVEKLLANPGIVRNRLKVMSTITNARAYLDLRASGVTFADHLWGLLETPGRPRVNAWTAMGQVPARTPESDRISKDLAKRGFKFVGSTICYAFMQAVGMVNDHLTSCPRHAACKKLA